MNTLATTTAPVQVSLESVRAEALANGGRWWPDLFLRRGRKLYAVTPLLASRAMDIIREQAGLRGWGASRTPDLPLYNIDGERIGRVTYNGRVWLHDIDGDKEIELPGVKTAAQCEAEGWR